MVAELQAVDERVDLMQAHSPLVYPTLATARVRIPLMVTGVSDLS
jgi:hypothetical protein